MKTTFTLLFILFYSIKSFAQCYGGTDFASAVEFDAGWISACNTGTSCNSGVTILSNQSSCEPTTAIDACASTPSCGNVSNMGSDLWFKFMASTSTATISVTRNVSFTVGIQAFAAPHFNFTPTCSQLTEIGCVADNSPNGNIKLNLTSLTPGDLYFFRVYGVDHSPSQRTGNFCFCGSTGLGQVSLPANGKSGSSNKAKASNKNLLSGFSIRQDNSNHRIIIYSDTDTDAEIYTLTGNKLATWHLIKGDNSFYHELIQGMYIIRKKDTGETQKFAFYH